MCLKPARATAKVFGLVIRARSFSSSEKKFLILTPVLETRTRVVPPWQTSAKRVATRFVSF